MLDFERVESVFAAAAETYQDAAVLPREVESRLLDRLRYLPGEIGRALDLGAGPGLASAALAKRVESIVIGMDVALPMLRLGAGTTPEPVPRVCADAAALPFADASFDLVFSNLALPWFADPGIVFTEVRRVLTPGGAFLFTTFGPDTLKELRACWAACDDLPHVHGFMDMHLLGDGLLDCGFADPVMDMELLKLTYADAHVLMRDLKNLGAGNLASGRRRALTGKQRFAAMLRAYEGLRTDDRIPASYEIVYGLARGPADGQPRRSGGMDIATFPVEHLRRSRDTTK